MFKKYVENLPKIISHHGSEIAEIERTGHGGSDPTTGPPTAKRLEASEEVKSGEREPNGTRATAHVHGRRCEFCDAEEASGHHFCRVCFEDLQPTKAPKSGAI